MEEIGVNVSSSIRVFRKGEIVGYLEMINIIYEYEFNYKIVVG